MSIPLLDSRTRAGLVSKDILHTYTDEMLPGSSTTRHSRSLGERAPNASLPSAADFFVESLPGLPNMASHPTHPLNIYAGELPSYPGEGQGGGTGKTGVDAYIFFLMAKARRSAGSQRVIFWFNGGPGCSSFDGALMEVGPFRTVPSTETPTNQTELKLVEGGWEEYATMVFIDQPPGTGLSYIPTNGYLHELKQASQHLIHFMENFYTVFPELAGQDTYLAGESYAGQYIPYFADALLQTDKLPKLNLKGLAIGNGWIDPIRQYPAYAEFAYEKGLIKNGTAEAEALETALATCNQYLDSDEAKDPLKTPINIDPCGGVMDAVRDPYNKEINGETTCMNIYDVRKIDKYPACGMNWPPDLADVYDFLRRPDVVAALHAQMHVPAWRECSGRVSVELHNNDSPASVHLLQGIIDRGVPVMMFVGAEDLICNHVGIERMIDAMTWNGATGWGVNTTADVWTINGTRVGEWTTDRNMTYVKIDDGSHMVGWDLPHVTNDMIMRFMGVDMTLVPGLTGSGTSKVGEVERPAVHFGEPPQATGLPLLKGGHSELESWYNAVSAVLILLTMAGVVGCYLYIRRRKSRRGRGSGTLSLPLHSLRDRGGRDDSDRDRDREERIPLGAAVGGYDDGEYDADRADREDSQGRRRDKGKGKARAVDEDEDREGQSRDPRTVFALEDEDE